MHVALLLVTLLAASGLAPAPSARADDLEELVRDLASEDDAVREEAIETLARRGKKAGDVLFGTIESAEAPQRARLGALAALGRMKKTGVKLLRERLGRPLSVPWMQDCFETFAMLRLAREEGAWAAPVLVDLVEDNDSGGYQGSYDFVRQAAVMALGCIGGSSKKAQKLVRELLEDDDEDAVALRVRAAVASWWLGAEAGEVYPVLMAALEVHPDVATQEAAIFGLGEMGTAASEAEPVLRALRKKVADQTNVTIDEALQKIVGKQPPTGPRKAD